MICTFYYYYYYYYYYYKIVIDLTLLDNDCGKFHDTDQQTNTSPSKSMFLCELQSTQNYRADLVTTITCRCSGPSTSKSLSLPHSARTYSHHGDSVSASQDPNTLQSSGCEGLSAAVRQAASCMEVSERKRRSTDVLPYCTVRPSETW